MLFKFKSLLCFIPLEIDCVPLDVFLQKGEHQVHKCHKVFLLFDRQ